MFGKNLKFYRLKKNMSKKALAEKCGISPMAITNYENEARRPDMETIKKLAEILEIGVADFIEARNETLVFNHEAFRKNNSFTKTEQEYIREAVEEYFGRFFDAVSFFGGNPLPEPPSTHHIKPSGDANNDAYELRKTLNVSVDGPVGDLYEILEDEGILIFALDVDNRHFSGMNGTVNEYPYIVVNNTMNQERIRSTIAHELVHIMFDFSGYEEKAEEKYANTIGGSFLISDDDLRREVGIKRTSISKDLELVCKDYGISALLLVYRLEQALIISSTVAQGFFKKASKAHWRTNEPSRIAKTQPTLFCRLVYRAINEEDVSITRGAELLRLPYAEVEANCGLMEVN